MLLSRISCLKVGNFGCVGSRCTHEFIDNIVGLINYYIVGFIAKKRDAIWFTDFRPISLVNSAYKVASKVLDNRLKDALKCLVGQTQGAFIKGRQILDGVIVANDH